MPSLIFSPRSAMSGRCPTVCHNSTRATDRTHWNDPEVLACLVGVRCRYYFNVEAPKSDQNDLSIPCHVGFKLRDAKNVLHFLQKRGLTVPQMTLKALITSTGSRKYKSTWRGGRPVVPFAQDPMKKLFSALESELQ